MSILTIAWSAAGGVCLSLAVLYLFVWLRHRTSLVHLLFSIAAFGAAGNAFTEISMLRATAVQPYISAFKYSNFFIFFLLVGLVWFVYLYFGIARRWLAVAITLCWGVMVIINALALSSIMYTEVSGLRELLLPWGERYSLIVGTSSKWRLVADFTVLAIVIYVIDATVRAWRRGGPLGTLSVGGSVVAFMIAAGVHSALVDTGMVNKPRGLTSLCAHGVGETVSWGS